MATYLADRVIVYDGEPSIHACAHAYVAAAATASRRRPPAPPLPVHQRGARILTPPHERVRADGCVWHVAQAAELAERHEQVP